MPKYAEVQRLLNLRENYTWKIPKQRRLFRKDDDRNRIEDIEYRPFDTRRIYYQRHVVYNPRFETMAQANNSNMFLLLCRQQYETGFRHAFVTRRMFECCVVSAKSREITSGFPLYVFSHIPKTDTPALFEQEERHANFSVQFLASISRMLGVTIVEKGRFRPNPHEISVNELTHYIYAVLHSPEYRKRYAACLKLDFPRIPIIKERAPFKSLVTLGGKLVALHLLESPKVEQFITTYTGPKKPEVGRVGWSGDTVWLDAGKTNAREGHRAAKPGTIGFKGVPEKVWAFHIGGYQVCHKWLKDRKGRTLSDDDIAHYQKIIVALNETIRIMAEIDAVIDQHGGWPAAFQTGADRDDA